MKNIIGAEAARWAGLQIDLHSKFRSGNITPDQLEWWLNQSINTRNAIIGDGRLYVQKLSKKFVLLVDLGIITVPDDYDHASQLKTFVDKNRKNFYFYNDDIIDRNFSNPTRVLKPGDKFRVLAFNQVDGPIASEERMVFLATQKAIHTGAQGASLVFDQKRDQLPKGNWYASFDEKDRLWKDVDGYHRVPGLHCCNSTNGFGFSLGHFEGVWRTGDAFLCFCDIE